MIKALLMAHLCPKEVLGQILADLHIPCLKLASGISNTKTLPHHTTLSPEHSTTGYQFVSSLVCF
ncbi:hypothetical protein L798_14041 [Zootermopsis nevadensis]|uniref:Uncharacterized protein n=1 Tax=Zootermopsis nevadensis TaxID=136037 RepID=A0A067R1E8_ZOONE|nr:hypothetical protein L798_14041 [Zootermopsis nevadensis]